MPVERQAEKTEASPAEIVREYGPYPGGEHVRGLTFDGTDVWFAAGEHIQSFDPVSGKGGRTLPIRATAGTAFDGQLFYQIADGRIQKLDPATGEVVGSIPAPGKGGDSGLTWAEGKLWVGQYRDRKIHQVDPDTGEILRTLDSARFVTGVTFVDGDLWHGTWEEERCDLRRIDPDSGELLESIALLEGTVVSGLESDGGDLFYCGGGQSGKVRAVRRPRRAG